LVLFSEVIEAAPSTAIETAQEKIIKGNQLYAEGKRQMAMKQFEDAMQLGCPEAYGRLGFFLQAHGNESEILRTVELSQQGAFLGDPLSISNLGLCYFLGVGVSKDVKQAVSYAQEAASLGCSEVFV
jgi:TPR repeat protein